jgi:hypothetical protein
MKQPERRAFPKPKKKNWVKMANPETVARGMQKQASKGLQIGPNTPLGRIKEVALKTFGFTSVLWLRQQIELDRTLMEQDRASYLETWAELAKYFSPRRPRFLASDVNKGWRRNQLIIDDTGGMCKDVLVAGMLAGICSPTRLWFLLTDPETESQQDQTARDWYYDVTQRIANVLYQSNFYEEVPLMFEDAATFATGLIWMAESDKEVVNFKSLPIGSYSIHHDPEGHIRTFYREFMMTVGQILDQWGKRDDKGNIINWDIFSQALRTCHDNDNFSAWFYIGHYVRPNHEYEPEAAGTQGFPFLETYYERGQVSNTAPGTSTTSQGVEMWRFISIRGLMQIPIMELIWKKTGEDDYGTECPGIRSIGDVRQLQAQEKRVSQASEKMINPPMQGPPTLKNSRVSLLAGDLTTYDQRDKDNGLRPIFEVALDIRMMEERSDRIRNRIKDAWHYGLFLMMQQDNMEGVQPITAAEVKEKQQEKLLMLSPVLEKANRTAFNPQIEFVVRAMMNRGMIPPPPPSLKGRIATIEYSSIFAQAMKIAELDPIKDSSAWIQQQAQATPEMLDVVDHDEMVRLYFDKAGAPPTLIRPKDDVDAIRKQRAQQQMQQQKMAMLQQQAEAAKNLAAAPTNPNDPNALTDLQQQAQAGSLVPQQ